MVRSRRYLNGKNDIYVVELQRLIYSRCLITDKIKSVMTFETTEFTHVLGNVHSNNLLSTVIAVGKTSRQCVPAATAVEGGEVQTISRDPLPPAGRTCLTKYGPVTTCLCASPSH